MRIFSLVLLGTICTFIAADTACAQNLYDVKVWDAKNQNPASAGTWVIGGTRDKLPLELRLSSADYGKTFTGTITYDRQAPGMGLKAVLAGSNTLAVETKSLARIRGSAGDVWAKDGDWVIGQSGKVLIQMDARSRDSGKNLEGNVTFLGSGSVRFSAALVGMLATKPAAAAAPSVAAPRAAAPRAAAPRAAAPPAASPSAGKPAAAKSAAPVREAGRLPLTAGTAFKKGTKYASPSGNFTVFFADDGNLIVTTREGKYTWGLDQVAKSLSRTARAEIKADGSFGVFEENGNAVWAAPGSRSPNATLNLTDDGVLQMVTPGREVLWSSNGFVGPLLKDATALPLTAGSTLTKGMKYPSPGNRYYLTFGEDGNLIVAAQDGRYVWGLDQSVRKLSRTSRVEIKNDGSFGVYETSGAPVWAASGTRDPKAMLNLTYDGVLQMTAPGGKILWASDGVLTPSLKIFQTKATFKTLVPETGWDKSIELSNPKMTILGTAAVSASAMNAVAHIYTEMTKRLLPTADNPNPKSKFEGFKVYITNGEPWSVLSQQPVVGTMWKDQTGPKSGNFLRGGASNNFVWISEQMIAKQGVKTRNADGTPDNTMRTFDQVVHEFAHSIDFQMVPDSVINKFTGNGTPVESFAFRVQQWFGVPGGDIPAAEVAELSKIFSSRATFSTEGYKP